MSKFSAVVLNLAAALSLWNTATTAAAPIADPSPCSLVWPKFGDVYPTNEPVYFMFYCNLTPEQDKRLSAESGNIKIEWGAFMHDMGSGGYKYLANGEQLVYSNPADRTISRDFKFSLFQKAPVGDFILSMKFTMRILIGGEWLDTMSTIVTPGSDDFLAGMLGSDAAAPVASFTCERFETEAQECIARRVHYDFMEIGTSGFDTLLEAASDELRGISIEPLKHLQDTLPNRENVHKVSCAIGDTPGWRDIYYLPNHFMEFNAIALKDSSDAQFLYGLGRVGELSPNAIGRVGSTGWIAHYVLHAKRTIVRMKTIGQICEDYLVGGISFLKLDCEGYDYKIMHSAFDYFESSNVKLPFFIEFENNSNYSDADTVIRRLRNLGYSVYSFLYDVTRVAHDSTVGAPHGVVYAERSPDLLEEDNGVARIAAINNLLPPDLLWGRELCADYHHKNNSSSTDTIGAAAKNGSYYCSILLSENKDVLSISDTFTIRNKN